MPAGLEDERDDEAEYDQQEEEDALPPAGVLLVPVRPWVSPAQWFNRSSEALGRGGEAQIEGTIRDFSQSHQMDMPRVSSPSTT